MLAVIYGMKKIAEGGPILLPTLVSVAGVAVGAVFLRRQKKLAHPLIDLSLFRSGAFSAALAVNVVGFFIAFGAFFFIAQYLQLVLGLGPLTAGLWTAPSGLAFIAGAQLAPVLAQRIRPAHVVAGGFAAAAVGFAVLIRIGGSHALAVVVSGYVLLSLGLAPVFTLATDLMVGAASPQRAGAASGLAETSSELGGALGIAMLGSLVTAVYRSLMTSLPADVPHAAAQMAHDTLGSAVTIAGGLPGDTGIALLAMAREAFTQAVMTAVAVSAALAAVALLRNAGATQPAAAEGTHA